MKNPGELSWGIFSILFGISLIVFRFLLSLELIEKENSCRMLYFSLIIIGILLILFGISLINTWKKSK